MPLGPLTVVQLAGSSESAAHNTTTSTKTKQLQEAEEQSGKYMHNNLYFVLSIYGDSWLHNNKNTWLVYYYYENRNVCLMYTYMWYDTNWRNELRRHFETQGAASPPPLLSAPPRDTYISHYNLPFLFYFISPLTALSQRPCIRKRPPI